VTLTDFELQVADVADDVCPLPCPDLDDADPAVEYAGGWHRKSDPAASGGGYHRRMGNNAKGAAARVVFTGSGITYFYAVSDQGGTADVYLDGVLRQTLSYAGPGAIAFGHAVSFEGLGGGTHELRIVHRSGGVYVDGFRVVCAGAAGADASAVASRSQTQVSPAALAEGAVITRSVAVGACDREVSVLVEGAAAPLTVRLLDPAGALLATGQALIAGTAVSGVDAGVSRSGTYTAQVLQPALGALPLEISIARTVRTGCSP
jgi:hypothetical protein